MHKVQESSSEHQLLAKKYRQRRQTQGKFSSVNEFVFNKSLRESDKENQSDDMNKSHLQVKFGEKVGQTAPITNLNEFSISRVVSALNLIDKTLVDCFMVKIQAERSIQSLGNIGSLDGRLAEELQLLDTFRTQLVAKIHSSLDEVSSKMKVAAEQHASVLRELFEFTCKNLEVLTVRSIDSSH